MSSVAINPSQWRGLGEQAEPAWEIALLFPRQGQWTEDEYLALDTNRLVELSDGRIEVLPTPPPFHQRIVTYVLELLRAFVVAGKLGEVLPAPLPVRLWPGKLREPDLVFVRPGRITDPLQPPNGADLAIEVVSEGDEDRKRDLITKRDEYFRAGIQEYWIVDPEENRLTVLTPGKSGYEAHGEFTPGMTATSKLLPGFSLDVAAVLAAGAGPV